MRLACLLSIAACASPQARPVDLTTPPPPPQPSKPGPPEPHDGFTIYPECRPWTTAVVSTGGARLEWMPHFSSAPAERDEFRGRALAAAGEIRSHSSAFGGGCALHGVLAIFVYPGQDVEAAAQRLGAWLVQTGQRAEIDLVVEDEPSLQ